MVACAGPIWRGVSSEPNAPTMTTAWAVPWAYVLVIAQLSEGDPAGASTGRVRVRPTRRSRPTGHPGHPPRSPAPGGEGPRGGRQPVAGGVADARGQRHPVPRAGLEGRCRVQRGGAAGRVVADGRGNGRAPAR